MKSISSKLIFSFLLVSLLSSGALVAAARVTASREFDQLRNEQARDELIEYLSDYYESNGSWEGLQQQSMMGGPGPHMHGAPMMMYTITDLQGMVVVAGPGFRPGEQVTERTLKGGTPIVIAGEEAGILLLSGQQPTRSALEAAFIRRLGAYIVFSGLAAVMLAVILGALISRGLSKPIRELTRATRKMADGDLHQQVNVHSNDEIGELAQAFNKMSSDLAKSFHLRRQMTADIAHELRTPLALIIGHAEAVSDGVLPASKENFEIIREEAGKLEGLVNDLRTLSLADAGELSLDLQPVEINQLLADVQSHHAHRFHQKRIILDLEPAPGAPKVTLDPMRFGQVLGNILDNALRYTPEGGRVEMTCKVEGGFVQITIHDSGEGVAAEEAIRLFDRFYRADPSRTRDEGGSGLGLAIAKSIVEMHNGKIWAESEKGGGLRVFIQLPTISN